MLNRKGADVNVAVEDHLRSIWLSAAGALTGGIWKRVHIPPVRAPAALRIEGFLPTDYISGRPDPTLLPPLARIVLR